VQVEHPEVLPVHRRLARLLDCEVRFAHSSVRHF
jgi:hypothetical protein